MASTVTRHLEKTNPGLASGGSKLLQWHYVAGLALVAAAVAVGIVTIYKDPPFRSVFDINYGFGGAVRAILVEHRYGMRAEGGYWAYAYRMPLIPAFLSLLTWLLHSFKAVFLVKDALCALVVLFVIIRLALSPLRAVCLAASIYLLPLHASNMSQIDTEEAYLFSFIIALAALLFTRECSDYIGVSLLVAAIYLTKSSMLLVCVAAVALVIFQDLVAKRLHLRSIMPSVTLFMAICLWGGFIYHYTGVFAFGANASSWNGWNFYKGNNALAVQYYPRINLDLLDTNRSLNPPNTVHISNEWDMHKWQLQMGKQFIKSHPQDVIAMDIKKIKVLLYDVGETPRQAALAKHPIVATLIVDHLVFAFAIGLALYRRDMASLAFGVIVTSCVLPYFASFLYQRHLLPVYGVAYCFALYSWGRPKASGRSTMANHPSAVRELAQMHPVAG